MKARWFDPQEFAIIRDMYFHPHTPMLQEIDPIERLERQYAKRSTSSR